MYVSVHLFIVSVTFCIYICLVLFFSLRFRPSIEPLKIVIAGLPVFFRYVLFLAVSVTQQLVSLLRSDDIFIQIG